MIARWICMERYVDPIDSKYPKWPSYGCVVYGWFDWYHVIASSQSESIFVLITCTYICSGVSWNLLRSISNRNRMRWIIGTMENATGPKRPRLSCERRLVQAARRWLMGNNPISTRFSESLSIRWRFDQHLVSLMAVLSDCKWKVWRWDSSVPLTFICLFICVLISFSVWIVVSFPIRTLTSVSVYFGDRVSSNPIAIKERCASAEDFLKQLGSLGNYHLESR